MTSAPTDARQPGISVLSGVRVVDFTQALSGPYCTLMLADLGADVIKVEMSGRGDDSRHWGPPFLDGDAAYFMSVNRNKKSVELDLKVPVDQAHARELIAGADVVIENWRPGTARRLGLDADTLRAEHPQLIHCSISGYGQDQGTRSGYDQILQGTSGVMSMTGPPGVPSKWGVPIGDIAAGMFASNAILAALYARTNTSTGQAIDISMQDCLISMLTHHAARHLATAVVPESDHNSHATIAPYGVFETRDGFVNICVGNDAQFERFCIALDLGEVANSAQFATNPDRVRNKPDLMQTAQAAISGLSTSEVVAKLETVGVPVGAVLDIGEALSLRQTFDRQMILSFDRGQTTGIRVVNTPWKFDGRAPELRLPPPHLGEHNQDLLSPSCGTPDAIDAIPQQKET